MCLSKAAPCARRCPQRYLHTDQIKRDDRAGPLPMAQIAPGLGPTGWLVGHIPPSTGTCLSHISCTIIGMTVTMAQESPDSAPAWTLACEYLGLRSALEYRPLFSPESKLESPLHVLPEFLSCHVHCCTPVPSFCTTRHCLVSCPSISASLPLAVLLCGPCQCCYIRSSAIVSTLIIVEQPRT